MIKGIFSSLVILICSIAHAQPLAYDAALIAPGLLKDARSVVREERENFDIKNAATAIYKVHKVVTVLSEAGKEELFFYEFTDKFHSLGDLELELYNSKGTAIHRYGKSDLSKEAEGEGLVPDGKVYYINIPARDYPVTLRMDYEIRYSGLLNYPRYYLQLPEQAVEHSSFTATVPADMGLRYKARNSSLQPDSSVDGKTLVYQWKVNNLPALAYEEGAVNRDSRYPHILLAPNRFELDGYDGDMSSWLQFGQWFNQLSKNTLNLSDDRKQFFVSLVAGAKDDVEKTRIIYNYLQKNCRYVSIQLGIGGFKPFEADFVDKKKYGDCKALSNYTQACLSAVGVKSYKALINAEYNKEPVDVNFPYNGFNHMIVCVPMAKDSIWLECTSTTSDFGVLGNFTENRNALLITEDGGKLVQTPRSKASENLFSTSSVVTLKEDGSGSARVMLNSSGEYKQYFLHYFGEKVKDEQKNYLVNDLGYLQPDEFEIIYDKLNRPGNVSLSMSLEKIPDFTAGSKQFLNPRIYKLWNHDLPKAENRTQDFYFYHPFILTDTTIYQLPEGFGIETMPKARQQKFAFGSFSSTYIYDEQKKTIITTARLELNNYKIPAAKFLETKKFFNEVATEYTEKIVIKKL